MRSRKADEALSRFARDERGLLVLPQEVLDRFLASIDRKGPIARSELGPCWIWTAHKVGYGFFCCGGGRIMAHRVSYLLHKGPIPPGLFVLHRCDVYECVRPDHLYVGTHRQNSEDTWKRGRRTYKLTDGEVQEGTRLYLSGVTMRELAEKFGVNERTISNAVRGRRVVASQAIAVPATHRNYAGKLTAKAVVELRTRYASGERTDVLMTDYSVAKSTVHGVVRGAQYRHVGGPITRGRTSMFLKGEAHPWARLRAATVREILQAFVDGESRSSLQSRYALSKPLLHAILRGRAWKSVSHEFDPDLLARVDVCRGEDQAQAKLTEGVVLIMREAFARGEAICALARRHGVSETVVAAVVHGKSWKHVAGPTSPPLAFLGGSNNSKSRLTDEAVLSARARYRNGERLTALAEEFGVHCSTIHLAVTGRTWKHLPGAVAKGSARRAA